MRFWLGEALCLVLVWLMAVPQIVGGQELTGRRLQPGGFLVAESLRPGMLKQEPANEPALQIVVIEGEDAINIIKKKTAVMPVVEVRDRNKQPIAGVAVTFTAPQNGASATFLNGARSVTLTTDASGRAAVVGMKPMNKGTFNIQATASFQGLTATATISQTNVLTAVAAAGAGGAAGAGAGAGLSTGALAAIIGGIAAAAVVGTVLGLHSSGSSATPTATIGVAGTPVVAAPH